MNNKKIDKNYIYIFHILIVAPFLFYIGYNGVKTPEIMFKILTAVSIVIILYHSYKFTKKNKYLKK